MEDIVKDYLISFYSDLLKLHGDRPESLRWTPKGQLLRYCLMLEIADSLEGKKILDYGCGKGDFYGFLKGRNITVDYTGLDINPDLIALAKQKYPGSTFEVLDIESEALDENFDFIFICGVFNNRVEGAKDSMLNTLSTLFPHARTGLALSGMSSYAPQRDIDINYVSPEEVLSYALKNITPYVALRHNAVPHDFTLFLYQSPNPPASGCLKYGE